MQPTLASGPPPQPSGGLSPPGSHRTPPLSKLLGLARKFRDDEAAATAAEYVLLAVLVAVAFAGRSSARGIERPRSFKESNRCPEPTWSPWPRWPWPRWPRR